MVMGLGGQSRRNLELDLDLGLDLDLHLDLVSKTLIILLITAERG